MMSLSTVVSVYLPKLTHGSSFAISRTNGVSGLSKSITEVSKALSFFSLEAHSLLYRQIEDFAWAQAF